MKDNEYFVIHNSVLPDYFEKIMRIKEMISKGINISEACREVELSRSTFYKYKDYVNRPSTRVGKRALLLLKLVDEPGVLSNVLNELARRSSNVLAINQEVPIHNIAYVNITCDILKMDISVYEFVQQLKTLKNILDVTLLAVE